MNTKRLSHSTKNNSLLKNKPQTNANLCFYWFLMSFLDLVDELHEISDEVQFVK